MTRILVTGGAGYVGSVSVEALLAAGHEVVVLDDLTTGHRAAVPAEATFHQAPTRTRRVLARLLEAERIEAILHCAARSLVGESIGDPSKYYRDNVAGGVALLEAARDGRGRAARLLLDRGRLRRPGRDADPRGRAAPADQPVRRDRSGRSRARSPGTAGPTASAASASATSTSPARPRRIGEVHEPETHLIPNVLAAAEGGAPLTVFGDDYPTPDGTCLRDYIHVADLADAHLRGDRGDRARRRADGRAARLQPRQRRRVLASARCCRRRGARRRAAHPVHASARVAPGDPPVLVARSTRAAEVLGWRPQRPSLEEMVGSAWAWRQRHPDGYGD